MISDSFRRLGFVTSDSFFFLCVPSSIAGKPLQHMQLTNCYINKLTGRQQSLSSNNTQHSMQYAYNIATIFRLRRKVFAVQYTGVPDFTRISSSHGNSPCEASNTSHCTHPSTPVPQTPTTGGHNYRYYTTSDLRQQTQGRMTYRTLLEIPLNRKLNIGLQILSLELLLEVVMCLKP